MITSFEKLTKKGSNPDKENFIKFYAVTSVGVGKAKKVRHMKVSLLKEFIMSAQRLALDMNGLV